MDISERLETHIAFAATIGTAAIRVPVYDLRDALDENKRLRAELIEWVDTYFREVASYDDKKDRWCTDGLSSAVHAGDCLVLYGVFESVDEGYGRVQFYRQKKQAD